MTPRPTYSPPSSSYASKDHWTPVKLTIAGPVGIPSGFFNNVCGLEVGALWNDSDSVYGVQACPICNIANDIHGLQIGGVNVADKGGFLQAGAFNYAGRFDGLQIGAINCAKGVGGLQIGAINCAKDIGGLQVGAINDADSLGGFQVGIINCLDKEMRGVRLGYYNLAFDDGTEMHGLEIGCGNMWKGGEFHGVQLGCGNVVERGHVYGAQIGFLINIAEELTGVQIGLINIVAKGPLPFFPFINACF